MGTLIDVWLPRFDVREVHWTEVDAPPEAVWRAVLGMDLSGSAVTRFLYRIRGLPADALTLEGARRMGFVELGREADRELVLGLIGRFWTPGGGIQRVTPDEFREFERPGFAKAAWNFAIEPGPDSTTLSTETRVRCPDRATRLRFRTYWTLIRPFSGAIRRAALGSIRDAAETASRSGGAPSTALRNG